MHSPASPVGVAPGDDLSALAWVHGELRRSLENAHKALRRHLREADAARGSDVDSVDPAVLRSARTQLHQGVGALELVGMPRVANVLRAGEAAAQRLVARPLLADAAAVATIERVSFAVLDFIARQLAGKPLSPVMLFPQYRAVQQLAGADRIHPADLWPLDFQWRELPAEQGVSPRASDGDARGVMEGLVLALMRGADRGMLTATSDFCAELGAGAEHRHEAVLWRLAGAVYQAQGLGLLAVDVYNKRLASRLLAQLRLAVRGQHDVSERLAQDLLFFCAHAGDAAAGAPRLAAVRQCWQLEHHPTADYETARLGRYDPALVTLARKRVASAKEGWSAVAAGELHRLDMLGEQFALVADSLGRLLSGGERLGGALQAAAAQTVSAAEAPPAALAMEVATAILYLDATIEDGEFDDPALGARVERLAQRIDEVRGGAEMHALEPWMEELYRRVSDRQTMGSVVHELRATLSEIEKQVDQFFRDPAERGVLIPVPGQLGAMRGVLSVLGLEQAAQAVMHMRDDIDALASTEIDPERGPQAGTFDRVADNLGALGFLIDMLSVQPALAKSLFRFDPVSGALAAVMGHSEREAEPVAPAAMADVAPAAAPAAAAESALPLPEQVAALVDAAGNADAPAAEIVRRLEHLAQQALAAEQPALARAAGGALTALRGAQDAAQRRSARDDLARALGEFVPAAPAAAPAAPARITPDAAPGGTGLEDDAEMREIFVEEAREVVVDASAALERLADAPDHAGDMTAVRRAFHTLKGSSRMVGLRDFGEAAWACEQLYNARLADRPRADPPLRQFTAEALAYFGAWVEAIAAGRDDGHRSAAVVRSADPMRLEGTRLPIAPAEAQEAPALEPLGQLEPVEPVEPGEPAEGVAADEALGAAEAIALPEVIEDVLQAVPGADEEPLLDLSLPPLELVQTLDSETPLEVSALPGLPLPSELVDFDLLAGADAIEALEPAPAAAEPLAVSALQEGTAPEPAMPLPLLQEVALPPVSDERAAPEVHIDLSEVDFEPPPSDAGLVRQGATRVPTSAFDGQTMPLTARIPDLPSAADLELGAPALPELSSVPASALPETDFDLDLSGLAACVPADASPQLPQAPQAEASAHEADVPLDFAPALPPAPEPAFEFGRDPEPSSPQPQPEWPAFEFDEQDAGQLEARTHEPAPALPIEPAAEPLAPEPAPQRLAAEAAFEHAPVEPDREGVFGESTIESTATEPTLESAQRPDAPFEAAGAEASAAIEDEQIKVIGPLRIAIPLFNIYLNEADELSRCLLIEIGEWGVDALHHPVPEAAEALAHKLAGSSATVGYADLSNLARSLEHALGRSRAAGLGREGEAELFGDASEEIRRLLHQFAAGFLRPAPAAMLERLADHERWPAGSDAAAAAPSAFASLSTPMPLAGAVSVSAFTPLADSPAEPAPAPAQAFDDDEDIDAVDAVDAELFPIFEDEAAELLPQLQARLREWHDHPGERGAASACMRTLHTFKGGARLAAAMRLGEMAHRLETAVEHLAAHDEITAAQIEPLLARCDNMAGAFEALRQAAPAAPVPVAVDEPLREALRDLAHDTAHDTAHDAQPRPAAPPGIAAAAEVPATPAAPTPLVVPPADAGAAAFVQRPAQEAADGAPDVAFEVSAQARLETAAEAPLGAPDAEPARADGVPAAIASAAIDWARFATVTAGPGEPAAAGAVASGAGAAVRVRAGLLDRLVNQAGEVAITRERIAGDVKQLQGSLVELTDSLERLRRQLRDIELQAETQIATRMESARAAGATFDALEMDRFTRFQELTRFMAESVNDVATLQRSLQRTLQSTEDELAAQARLTRDLQDDLLRTRMVEFESLAERLYRTVRQAAKETGKQVRLDIVGGAIEIDRGVLERMAGSFEHLLRNSVAHGIEPPAARQAAGKTPAGRIQVSVAQNGNEVAVELADDGGGFDYERIRRRGIERGLIDAGAELGASELAQLLFHPGFSTAETVTELAGRGVGLDVVRAEVNAIGGRIETASARGQGTRFRLLLPLTTAVTQVVMLRSGTLTIAVPSTLVEVVRRVGAADTERAYASGTLEHDGENVPFFWLAALLQAGTRGDACGARAQAVVIIRSAAQRVAVHVDEVLGNQEVVVKNVGAQLARLPGLSGVTLLPSGAVALIYNPVALAAVYGEAARRLMHRVAPGSRAAVATDVAPQAPLVLVVDDSLTVRRVTQRLLLREGYRVVTAKDGLEALEHLAEERPAVLLSDIEMPRMDGFDLVRNVRADARLSELPVVMITSRMAHKHRDYAIELGANHYLGKPYSEEELLSLVARYAGADVSA